MSNHEHEHAGGVCRYCGQDEPGYIDVVATAGALGVHLTPCGLNADWCGSAWHLDNGNRPNTVSGDLYLTQDDDDDDLFSLVVRVYTGSLTTEDGGNDLITEIAEGDLQTMIHAIKETTDDHS